MCLVGRLFPVVKHVRSLEPAGRNQPRPSVCVQAVSRKNYAWHYIKLRWLWGIGMVPLVQPALSIDWIYSWSAEHTDPYSDLCLPSRPRTLVNMVASQLSLAVAFSASLALSSPLSPQQGEQSFATEYIPLKTIQSDWSAGWFTESKS
jgi:hypothetical protein